MRVTTNTPMDNAHHNNSITIIVTTTRAINNAEGAYRAALFGQETLLVT